MYRLIDQHGVYACSVRTGQPFEYGTHQLAVVAARVLGKRDARRYEVVAA